MMEDESTSVCAIHPGVAVTGFCPACLRDRLAGLHPPASADLRRCKSFSYYARSTSSLEQPHRRSCDARARQPPPISLPEPIARPMKDHVTQETKAFGSLGKRWQEWRRKTKLKKLHQHATTTTSTRLAMPLPPESSSCDALGLGRRSCDAFSTRTMLLGLDDPRASCDGGHLPPQMLFVPRSDDQIPVEEEEEPEALPGGTAQTRDYYLDSSSSTRRRRSVDRKSFSSDAGELPRMVAVAAGAVSNARVSPAVVGSEFYHHQQQPQPLTHHYQHHQPSFAEPPFLGQREEATKQSKHKSKGIKWWSIWGLLHKKSSSSSNISAFGGGEARAAAAPELRARGYDGQTLRCNSSVSARSSFSGFNGGLGRMRRADQVLLERNFSARCSSSSSASCRMSHQFHKDKDSNSISDNYGGGGGGGRPPRSSALSRSSLGLYYY